MINFFKNKKVFITGTSGFKGVWLCRILKILGAEVTGYTLMPPTLPSLFDLLNIEEDANTIISDIRSLDMLKQAVCASTPDVVIHLAAQPLVRDSYKDPVYTYETNVMGTVNILEAVKEYGKVRSFLNVTTDKVYKNIECHRGYKESDELNGRDPYSNSKSCSELVTQSYKNSFFCNTDTSVSTARSGNVIGGGDFATDRIIPDAVRAIQNKKQLVLRNPNSVRPYQHVIESLFAYLLIIKKQYENKSFEGNYNIGPAIEDCITTSKLVDMFNSYFNDASWAMQDNGVVKSHEACLLYLDTQKIRNIFNWKPKISISKAVEMTAEFTLAYLNDKNYSDVINKQIKEYIQNYD